jgi:hypothetical protein
MKLALQQSNQQRYSQRALRMSTRTARRQLSYTPILLFCLVVALLAMS